MRKIFVLTILMIFLHNVAYCAIYPDRETIKVYEGETRNPSEVGTIFIDPNHHLLDMRISQIDNMKFNEDDKVIYFDTNRYEVLPGKHKIVVGYKEFKPKPNPDREKTYHEVSTTINIKPGYIYELDQHIRKYVSDPVGIRVAEYLPGQKMFKTLRRINEQDKEDIAKMDPVKDKDKILYRYRSMFRNYIELGEPENAKKTCQEALKMYPEDDELNKMMFTVLMRLEDYAAAEKKVKEIQKYEKRAWVTDGLWAEIYAANKQKDKAVVYFNRAIEQAPDQTKQKIMLSLASFYRKMGDEDKFRDTMKRRAIEQQRVDKLYLEITEEYMKLMQGSDVMDEEARSRASQAIMEKYNINFDQVYTILTSTLYRYGEELQEKYSKKEKQSD